MSATPDSDPGSGSFRTVADGLFPGVFLRGVLMGAADVVPGVSGGTIAFITGIYQRLINAISACDLTALRLLLRGDIAAAWNRFDGSFLLVLFSGVILSALSLARLITYLLTNHSLLLWSFFFGLISASSLVLLREVRSFDLATCAALMIALALAVSLAVVSGSSLPVTPLGFFVAGFLGICAMILPGVSGSFILVLLGMYEPTLQAIKGLEWVSMLCFVVGCACGLLAFSRLLRWLLDRFYRVTLAALTGFLIGSLPVVWPWKLSASEGGVDLVVSPARYAAESGDSQLLFCVILGVLGFAVVWLIERHSVR